MTPDLLKNKKVGIKSRDGGPGDSTALVTGNFKQISCHDSCIGKQLHPDRHKTGDRQGTVKRGLKDGIESGRLCNKGVLSLLDPGQVINGDHGPRSHAVTADLVDVCGGQRTVGPRATVLPSY